MPSLDIARIVHHDGLDTYKQREWELTRNRLELLGCSPEDIRMVRAEYDSEWRRNLEEHDLNVLKAYREGGARPMWTHGQLRRLRHAITAGGAATAEISYADVAAWYARVLAEVGGMLARIDVNGLRMGAPSVSCRVKSLGTLRDKLCRTPMPLERVQDVAGVRIVADMPLDVQDMLTLRLCHALPVHHVTDLRDGRHSGYRAIHVILRLDGCFAEVQIRTVAQNDWANRYELLGDVFGRQIRYGGTPSGDDHGMVERMREESRRLARAEGHCDVPPPYGGALFSGRFAGWCLAYDRATGHLDYTRYDDYVEAVERYGGRLIASDGLENVVIGATTPETFRVTHSRYLTRLPDRPAWPPMG